MPTTYRTVVSIFDKKYTLSSERNDENYIQSVAKTVDDSMRLLSHENKKLPAQQIAIIAALDLVEELLSLRSDFDSIESKYAIKTERLTASIGQALIGQTNPSPSTK